MNERIGASLEKETCLGMSTLDLAKRIISRNELIRKVHLRVHGYTPHIHQDGEDRRLSISTDSFLKLQQQHLNQVASRHGEGWNVSLSSDVTLWNHQKRHLILADLVPQKSAENLDVIKRRFNEIIKPRYGGGFLLETGTSYHYFGEKIVDQDDWRELLGRLLITSIVIDMPPGVLDVHRVLVDYRHVGHSLMRNATSLRLTTRGTKTFSPVVVDFI